MDCKKIGAFLARERKAARLTQAEAAKKLFVSEKTISKWENGRGLPDTAVLVNLCSLYDFSLNELLSGERLEGENYRKRAERNMEELLSQRRSNRRKIALSVAVCGAAFSVLLVCVALSAFLSLDPRLKIALLVYGFAMAVLGVGVAAFADINAGSFVCRRCGKKFAPSAKEYVFSIHTLTARKLRCPFCGAKDWCKKSLQNGDE